MKLRSDLLRVGMDKRYCLTTVKLTTRIPAHLIYAVLADFRHYYPHVVPKCSVHSLNVCLGGKGTGTLMDFNTYGLLPKRSLELRVDEPIPGKIIVLTSARDSFRALYALDELEDGRTTVEVSLAIRLCEKSSFMDFFYISLLSTMISFKHVLTLLRFVSWKNRHVIRMAS
jgi:hypothetical protein